ncbi:MAG: hypothetical protein IJR50_01335 [Treponema sp.]|nr:hypothetical protein [Treponema sp.]
MTKMIQAGACLAIAFVLCTTAFSQSSDARKKFIRGSIADKTAAVRESSEPSLARDALNFALAYKTELGNDRDLDALAVAGVLALSADGLDYASKKEMIEMLSQLFALFPSDTVRVAVLNKVVMLKNVVPVEQFAEQLESFLAAEQSESIMVKAAIQTLGEIGAGNSFVAIYNGNRQQKWQHYKAEVDNALASLADKSLPHILAIIQEGNVKDGIRPLFDLFAKSEKISASFKSEIAENVLSQTIYIANNSSAVTRETVSLQIDALAVIVSNRWTRAAQSVLAFFELAEREYRAGVMTGDEFVKVVNGVASVAPVDASSRLSSYLAELNKQTESGSKAPEKVVLAVIDALGNIGDKSSFDTLLYVTYVKYPDTVVAAARDALARLKW